MSKQVLENALCTVVQALCMVMAGSGDPQCMRLVRALKRRRQLLIIPANAAEQTAPQMVRSNVLFGNHIAVSQALGFLFLGGGRQSFSNSPTSVAFLLMSVFPHHAWEPADNRCVPQILKHMYALAAEERALIAVDIEGGAPVHVPVEVAYQQHDEAMDAYLSVMREGDGKCGTM